MDLDFFKSKWNLLFVSAEAILVTISGFIHVPLFAAAALSLDANYRLLAQFVLGVIIALMLIPSSQFDKKSNRGWWAIVTILLLFASLFLYFKFTSITKDKTIDYTTKNGQYIVKGDSLFDEKKTLFKEIETAKGSKLSETEFFAENMEFNDSLGILTATELWPKDQIERNAEEIVIFYLCTVLFFSLTAICAVQTVFCLSQKE